MASHLEIEQQISFALDRLGAKNQHHEFEHICRRVARERVCRNILPGTGPVAAGGDQGRDFETFRSHMRQELGEAGWFLGKVSKGAIAFACSLQRDGVPTKIKKDIASICGGMENPDAIHFFSGVPVPVATRHKLQVWANNNHGVHLEIYDSEFLAEHLADPDLFWIATEYLSVPAELYPKRVAVDDNYESVRERWRDLDRRGLGHADFVEVRDAAVSLLDDVELHADVGLWLECLETFFRPTPSPAFQLKERARYEFLVLRLRVKGDLLGEEDLLRNALQDAAQTAEWSMLFDAATLCNYAAGAVIRGRAAIDLKDIHHLRDAVVARVETLLNVTENVSERCWLMHVRGYMSLQMEDVTDLAELFNWWGKVAALASSAHLYPIGRLSRHVNELTPLIAGAVGYEELVQSIDVVVAEREGRGAMADGCIQRAATLRKVGKLTLAVHELNRAKVLAYSQERLPQVVVAVLLVANWYQELGCTFASKYYSLAAAHLGINNIKTTPSLQRFIRPAIVSCAECDYTNGAFAQCLEFLELGLKAESWFESDDIDPWSDDDYQRIRLYGSYVLVASAEGSQALYNVVRRRIEGWPDGELFFDLEQTAKKAFSQIPRGVQDGKPVFRAPLFTDLTAKREVTWSALGVTWKVKWENNARVTLAAEQLLATLQIVCVDLSRWDLYLLPSECVVKVHTGATDNLSLSIGPGNDRSTWVLIVPERDTRSVEERYLQDMSAVITMLGELSLKPDLMKWIEEAYKRGLADNTFIVGPYSQLWSQLVDVSAWDEVLLHEGVSVTLPEDDETHTELAWNDSVIPEYNESPVQESLQRRYECGVKGTQVSLPRWLAQPGTESIIGKLRSEGWLDWQILSGFLTYVLNCRVAKHLEPTTQYESPSEWKRVFGQLLMSDEPPDVGSISFTGLTEDSLRMLMEVNALSTLQGLGLRPRQVTPSFTSILRFLRHKARFFDDDTDHDDILAVPREPLTS